MAGTGHEWSMNNVRIVIDEAEAAFAQCWNLLAAMKAGEPSGSILNFQPLLAAALRDLSRAHTQLGSRKDELICRKGLLSRAWFGQAMRRLASHQDALRGAVVLGKSLGDAFAWFLYQNDVVLLAEHASHPRPALVSGGVGGAAEFEMACRVQHVDDAYVLHHCTTTILRIGDVSLLRSSPLRVIGIGELKAGAKCDGFVNVDLSLLLRERSSSVTAAYDATAGAGFTPTAGLASRQRARYERQMRRMESAFATAAKPVVDVSMETAGFQYWNELADAAEGCERGRFKAAHLGGGLMVSLYRSRRRTLYHRLRAGSAEAARAVSDEVGTCARALLKPGSPYNSLSIGSLQYGADGQPNSQPGTMPLFWSPLPIEVIRRIIFGEMIAVTLFNPAPLFATLGKAGFSVASYDPPAQLTLRIREGERIFTMMNAGYWVQLIPSRLFREEQVVEVLLRIRDVLLTNPPANRGRIEVRLNESLLPPGFLDAHADVAVS